MAPKRLFDAAFTLGYLNCGYFLSGSEFTRYTWGPEGGYAQGSATMQPGENDGSKLHNKIKGHLFTSSNLPSKFTSDLDAVFGSDPEDIYLFKGSEGGNGTYVQYDFKEQATNPPGPIFGKGGLFPNATPFKIDAAVAQANGDGFIFSGKYCYHFNINEPNELYDSARRTIEETWNSGSSGNIVLSGDFLNGIDAALPSRDMKSVYLFRGDQFAVGDPDRRTITQGVTSISKATWPRLLSQLFDTRGEHAFTVPAGVNQISAFLWGSGAQNGGGGGSGGAGAFASGVLDVSPGDTLNITVGSPSGSAISGDGGGGLGAIGLPRYGGGGGGMSAIWHGAAGSSPLLIAAGGGGGGGGLQPDWGVNAGGAGGAGGAPGLPGGASHGDGLSNPAQGGTGGTTSGGGTGGADGINFNGPQGTKGGDGSQYQGGAGDKMSGGGGGGGYFGGGGGGGAPDLSRSGGGGGGGSCYIANGVTGSTVQSGNGATPGGADQEVYRAFGAGSHVGVGAGPGIFDTSAGNGMVFLTW